MAKKSKVETEIFDEIRLNVTSKDLAEAIAKHELALEAQIRGGVARPLDGDVLTLIQTIKALRSQIIPSDDPAGRGLGQSDIATED